jgi:hypothetical protein
MRINLGALLTNALRAPAGGDAGAPEFRQGEALSARKLNEIAKSINRLQGGADPAKQTRPDIPPVARSVSWLQGAGSDGESLDMPDNGKDFEPFIPGPEIDLRLERIYAYFTAGTFSCQFKVDGTLVGTAFTQSSTFPLFLDPPVLVEKGKKITVNVSSSSGVKGFQATAVLMPA